MIKQNVSLKEYSHYKIGGYASYFAEVCNIDELQTVIKEWKEIVSKKEFENRVFVLGAGTNVLFSDEGYDGLVIKISGGDMQIQGDIVTVSAGYSMNKLVMDCAEAGLSGLEWAGGLPGTVGGAVRGNAGAFKGETKDSVTKVISVEIDSGKTIERNNDQCKFGYRDSVYKGLAYSEVIMVIELQLTKSDRESVKTLSQERLQYRLKNHPMEYPSLGSTFKNVPYESFSPELQEQLKEFMKQDPFPIIPVGILIDKLGLKKTRIGGIEISEKHANFFVNIGGAKATDVIDMIELVKKKVKDGYGVDIEPEIAIVK